jgi:hypothetical protein
MLLPNRKKPIGWSTFRLGFASGLSIMFFAIVVCLFVYTEYSLSLSLFRLPVSKRVCRRCVRSNKGGEKTMQVV